jgi:CheY-like chemotaxis protein
MKQLKILWIEDKPNENISNVVKRSLEQRGFRIEVTTSPEEVAKLYRDARERASRAKGSLLYQLEGAPFDIVIADLKLDERYGGVESGAARAPTAGLTTAVLAALNCPDHPAAIVPYSAYDDQFGFQYQLLSLLAPSTIQMLHDERINKSRELDVLVSAAVRTFREEAIYRALQEATVAVDMSEIDRLRVQSSRDANLDEDEAVALRTPWGLRDIALKALFADAGSARGDVPCAALREWLDHIAVANISPEDTYARYLADLFWRVANSGLSGFRYYIARRLGRGEKVEALSEVDLRSKPFGWTWPWLLGGRWRRKPADIRSLRLAVLFLILREESRRAINRLDFGTLEVERVRGLITFAEAKGRDSIERRESLPGDIAQIVHDLDKDAEWGALMEQIEKSQPEELSEALQSRRMEAEDVLRLLDALPEKWAPNLTLSTGEDVGRQLARLTFGENDKQGLHVAAMLAGDGSCLTDSEVIASKRYALAGCGKNGGMGEIFL